MVVEQQGGPLTAADMEINDAYAAENRLLLKQRNVFMLNVLGEQGVGKTSLLARMLRLLQQHIRVAVIEGDLATAKDAQRFAESGVSVVQINAAGGGHLDAFMISQVLPGFYLDDIDMLMVENVSNLEDPAAFDLGEDMRMVVLSIADADDKPSKYPAAFLSAEAAVLNKMDMLGTLDLDLAETKAEISARYPALTLFETCCRKGEVQGVDQLADYLIALCKQKRLQNRD